MRDHGGDALTVREARGEDAATLGRLVAELDGAPVGTGDIEVRLERILADPRHAVLVAERSDVVLGWAHVFVAERLQVAAFGEVAGLVVADAAQGTGIGSALLAASEAWALEQGVHEMRIRSRAERHGAHAFYSGRGYEARKQQAVFIRALG